MRSLPAAISTSTVDGMLKSPPASSPAIPSPGVVAGSVLVPGAGRAFLLAVSGTASLQGKQAAASRTKLKRQELGEEECEEEGGVYLSSSPPSSSTTQVFLFRKGPRVACPGAGSGDAAVSGRG